MKRISVFGILPLVISVASPAWATKACDLTACRDSGRRLLPEACTAAADWIAVGRITAVKRDLRGDPLNKDFAEFTFEMLRTEKGPVPAKLLKFKVGWCLNPTELPSDTRGEFRIFGKNGADPTWQGGALYLDLEKVSRSTTAD